MPIFLGSNGIVQISDTGDRVSDYSLFDLEPTTGRFEVCARSSRLVYLHELSLVFLRKWARISV